MLQPRIPGSSRAFDALSSSFCSCFASLRLSSKPTQSAFSTTFIRNASHQAQGRANGPKDSAGRRLGAKKTSSEYVIPGNIIFRQRGTKWHPGENVSMGRDHTIYATETGYVRYYRDPERHPDRRYIGVALQREGPLSILPTPKNAARRRRLNMVLSPRQKTAEEADLAFTTTTEAEVQTKDVSSTRQSSRPQYMFREANWEIGRAAEKKGITVREFDRNDRWLAWRKRAAKAKRGAVLRAAKASTKTKGKKAKRGGK